MFFVYICALFLQYYGTYVYSVSSCRQINQTVLVRVLSTRSNHAPVFSSSTYSTIVLEVSISRLAIIRHRITFSSIFSSCACAQRLASGRTFDHKTLAPSVPLGGRNSPTWCQSASTGHINQMTVTRKPVSCLVLTKGLNDLSFLLLQYFRGHSENCPSAPTI